MKFCTKCGIRLTVDNTHRTSAVHVIAGEREKRYSYRRSECKECRSKAKKEYYKKKRDEILSKQRKNYSAAYHREYYRRKKEAL